MTRELEDENVSYHILRLKYIIFDAFLFVDCPAVSQRG